MKNGLELIDLKVWLKNRVIAGLTAVVPPGGVLTIMGPSGSGKSSLLAAITGTLAPALRVTGQVRLNGQDVTGLPPQDRHIGILFQDDLLFPHLSVAQNLAFALPSSVRPNAVRTERIEAALADVDLAGFGHRDPATLSGGQRARVALARCLLSAPRALVLDEPFSRLDAELRDQIRTLVFSHAKDRAIPVILVTHDPDDAAAAAGPVVGPSDTLTAPEPDPL